jgi:hypothetical protein
MKKECSTCFEEIEYKCPKCYKGYCYFCANENDFVCMNCDTELEEAIN